MKLYTFILLDSQEMAVLIFNNSRTWSRLSSGNDLLAGQYSVDELLSVHVCSMHDKWNRS